MTLSSAQLRWRCKVHCLRPHSYFDFNSESELGPSLGTGEPFQRSTSLYDILLMEMDLILSKCLPNQNTESKHCACYCPGKLQASVGVLCSHCPHYALVVQVCSFLYGGGWGEPMILRVLASFFSRPKMEKTFFLCLSVCCDILHF